MDPVADAPVLVNGSPQACPQGGTVAALLAERGVEPRGTAVERNGAVVRRADWGSTPVRPGDRIEIVRLVGGG